MEKGKHAKKKNAQSKPKMLLSVKLYERTVVEHLCKIYGRDQCIKRIFNFPRYRRVHRAVMRPVCEQSLNLRKNWNCWHHYIDLPRVLICLRCCVCLGGLCSRGCRNKRWRTSKARRHGGALWAWRWSCVSESGGSVNTQYLLAAVSANAYF